MKRNQATLVQRKFKKQNFYLILTNVNPKIQQKQTSAPNQPNQVARLVTPYFTSKTTGFSLEFFYHA
jgi:hypothetical protein